MPDDTKPHLVPPTAPPVVQPVPEKDPPKCTHCHEALATNGLCPDRRCRAKFPPREVTPPRAVTPPREVV